jgi:hypothetical protein
MPVSMVLAVLTLATRSRNHRSGCARSVRVARLHAVTLFRDGDVGAERQRHLITSITTGKDPYPSVADVFTLAMYAVLSAGFFLSIRAYKGLLDLRRPMLIAASVSSVLMAIVYFAVIGPYVVFAPAGSQPLVTRIFNTAYPVMDAFVADCRRSWLLSQALERWSPTALASR